VGVGLALTSGQVIPPGLGYPLARFMADRISVRRELAIVHTVRANQWIVNGGTLFGEQLDCAVRDTFRNTARCLYDLYHNLRSPASMQRLIAFSQGAEEMIARTQENTGSQTERNGIVIVGIHLSNFDLALQAAGTMGLNVQVLSAAQPGSGYRWQNELRRLNGLTITPASVTAVRQAVDRLRSGRSVLTGIDRPIFESNHRPLFFGRPASLPLHHVYLAIRAKAPIYLFAAILGSDGVYRINASEPIQMRPYSNRDIEMLRNAEAVLEVAEYFIRQAPQQWSMYFPVWPDAMKEIH
jgi:KDO2-lipid IV(A) lauroyltransferase